MSIGCVIVWVIYKILTKGIAAIRNRPEKQAGRSPKSNSQSIKKIHQRKSNQ